MLNLVQLQFAVAAAKKRFALIRKKYPELKAYLVLSMPGEQTSIDSSPTQILDECPALIIPGRAKNRALDLLEQVSQLETSLKNRSSPESDDGLKKKVRQASRLEDEIRSQYGNQLKALASRLNEAVYETRERLKGWNEKERAHAGITPALMEKLAEMEQAQNELKAYEAQKRAELSALQDELQQLAATLQYDEKCQVEIRFSELKYDLVWKLQTDDLVDRNLTPQTKASIRIVLGTLAQFERTHHES